MVAANCSPAICLLHFQTNQAEGRSQKNGIKWGKFPNGGRMSAIVLNLMLFAHTCVFCICMLYVYVWRRDLVSTVWPAQADAPAYICRPIFVCCKSTTFKKLLYLYVAQAQLSKSLLKFVKVCQRNISGFHRVLACAGRRTRIYLSAPLYSVSV